MPGYGGACVHAPIVTPPIENKGDVLDLTDNRHGIEDYIADSVGFQQIVLSLESQWPKKLAG
jgi:hypothetical protein